MNRSVIAACVLSFGVVLGPACARNGERVAERPAQPAAQPAPANLDGATGAGAPTKRSSAPRVPSTPRVSVADAPRGPTVRPSETSVPTTAPATSPATTQSSADVVARIRDEGMNRSQVMKTLSYLTDVIGPRLTGSPNLRRANEWTRDTMASWGMSNAHLEPWGPFGRGWSLRRFSAQVVEPDAIPLIAYPKAWSPGFEAPVEAELVYLDAASDSDLEKYRGKLRGAIVLVGTPRDMQARFEPLATRVSDADLLKLANAAPGATDAPFPGRARTIPPAERRAMLAGTPLERALRRGATTQPSEPASQPVTEPTTGPTTGPTSAPATGPTTTPFRRPGQTIAFLLEEGAAAMLTPSRQGDGGTLFVANAELPVDSEDRRDPDNPAAPTTRPTSGDEPGAAAAAAARRNRGPRIWETGAPATIPQVMLAAEQYNRLVRMIQQGEKLTMALDLQVRFHDDDAMAYNTVAEIPGSDRGEELVMLGAHMDSWHSGTGATDNGAGCAVIMEAARILRALDVRPRRTVRVALWTGEEQGIFGSKAYVAEHFGSYPADDRQGRRRGPTTRPTSDEFEPGSQPASQPASQPSSRPARRLTTKPDYDKLSVYFNLDNGTGKVRGVYLQGNEAVRPIFRKWLAPFEDLGASTLTAARTGGTDHTSFDAVGLPGFQFIQDPIEYWTRTHHSNADVYERAQADDLKEAAVILATFVYDAAMADEMIPRKPVE